MAGKDIFALAETGSGKTGAFGIPLLHMILSRIAPSENVPDDFDDDNRGNSISNNLLHERAAIALILSPTRELAQQTEKFLSSLGKRASIVTLNAIGGEDISKQQQKLKNGVHFLVATPGRTLDLISQKFFDPDLTKYVVFDEADRLFDMGFKKDIEAILKRIPEERQLIMMSATSNDDVMHTAYKFHSRPEVIELNSDSMLVDQIDHKIALVGDDEKFALLVQLLRTEETPYCIVFCNTQIETHTISEWLKAMNFKARPISGRLPQTQRTKLLQDFRDKKITVLVCTDVAARGLDIKDIGLVINYDLPREPANYVHRIGRTGRAGKNGKAISFCAYSDSEFLDPITKYIGVSIEKMELSDKDFAKDLCKRPFIDRKTLGLEKNTYQNSEKTEETKEDMHKNKRKNFKDKRENFKDKRDNKETKRTNGEYQERKNKNEKEFVKKKNHFKENKKEKEELPSVDSEIKNADTKKEDRRVFHLTHTSETAARRMALEYFRLDDEALLEQKITAEGKKKYFIFGPRETTYEFSIRPIFKKLLRPLLIKIIQDAHLDLYVKVSYREPNLKISFSGEDLPLLEKNRNELLFAFEHIIKQYLTQNVLLPKRLRIQLECYRLPQEIEDELHLMARKAKTEVLKTGHSVLLKSLSPADRRIVHQFLDQDPDVQTISVGDGRFKQIRVEKRGLAQ